ncbi:MAG TPA: HPP family protein [Sphingobacteriaceae bacterium]|nr:HPP family protein [Sphingobacteriaceae bacterium]
MGEVREAPKGYFQKWSGQRVKADLPQVKLSQGLWSFIGGFVGITLLAYLALQGQLFTLFAPFGASAVLLYGAPAAPFSQPRNLLGGHLLAAFIGVTVNNFFGSGFLAVGLGVALAIGLMVMLRVVHPPAGATALLGVTASQGSYAWLVSPVLAGALLLLLVALVVNNLDPERHYPAYWY